MAHQAPQKLNSRCVIRAASFVRLTPQDCQSRLCIDLTCKSFARNASFASGVNAPLQSKPNLKQHKILKFSKTKKFLKQICLISKKCILYPGQYSIYIFFAPSDSIFSNSCISANYYPIITNHTSMEILFIQLSDDVEISILKNGPL